MKKNKGTSVLVPHSFDIMKKILTFPISAFDKFGQVFHTPNGRLIYKDNGSDILAVAHLDSVAGQCFCKIKDNKVYSPWLDDRLGAYIILYILPKLGIKTDILLTEGEESGHSTAEFFNKDQFKVHNRQYNWMVEFDRRGEDVVMYQFECDDLTSKLEQHEFKTGYGSFTDLCYLDHLGCLGFNVAIGYENYHSNNAYADLDVLDRQLERFSNFYDEFKDQYMEYDPKVCGRRTYSYTRTYYDYDAEYYDYHRNYAGSHTRYTKKCKWCLADKIQNPVTTDRSFCDGCGTCIVPGSQQYNQVCITQEVGYKDENDEIMELQSYILEASEDELVDLYPDEYMEYCHYGGKYEGVVKFPTTFQQWLLIALVGISIDTCVRCEQDYAEPGQKICSDCNHQLGKDFRGKFFEQYYRASRKGMSFQEWARLRDKSLARQHGNKYLTLTEGMSLHEKAMITYAMIKDFHHEGD